MRHDPARAPSKSFCRLSLLAGCALLALGFLAVPRPAAAQSVVVAKFSDRSGKRLGAKAWNAVAAALKKKGAKLTSINLYFKQAKRNRIKPARALTPNAIKTLSGKLKLDGVVTGAAARKKRQYVVTVKMFGPDGKLALEKSYTLKRPLFTKEQAAEVAGLIIEATGAGAVATAPEEPPPPPPDEAVPPPPEGTEAGGGNDAFLPPWARVDKPAEGTGGGAPPADKPPAATPETGTETAAPAERSGKRKFGSSNDVLVAVGGSFHHRAGLDPRHEASLFPGLRFDGRMFLGTFLDNPWLGGIGFGGMFDMSLGLKYGYANTEDSWSATQMQWRAELLYRYTLLDGLAPAFILRLGYGQTSCSIDSGGDPMAKSVSYGAPYAALDISLFLWRPYLRMYATGAFLFLVAPGSDAGGDGMGFQVAAGIDVDVISAIHIGIGYDLTQYLMSDGSATGMGDYSDTYQSFFLRAGYNFH